MFKLIRISNGVSRTWDCESRHSTLNAAGLEYFKAVAINPNDHWKIYDDNGSDVTADALLSELYRK